MNLPIIYSQWLSSPFPDPRNPNNTTILQSQWIPIHYCIYLYSTFPVYSQSKKWHKCLESIVNLFIWFCVFRFITKSWLVVCYCCCCWLLDAFERRILDFDGPPDILHVVEEVVSSKVRHLRHFLFLPYANKDALIIITLVNSMGLNLWIHLLIYTIFPVLYLCICCTATQHNGTLCINLSKCILYHEVSKYGMRMPWAL